MDPALLNVHWMFGGGGLRWFPVGIKDEDVNTVSKL